MLRASAGAAREAAELASALGDLRRVEDADLRRILTRDRDEDEQGEEKQGRGEEDAAAPWLWTQRLRFLLAKEANRQRREYVRDLCANDKRFGCSETFAKFAADRARRKSEETRQQRRNRGRKRTRPRRLPSSNRSKRVGKAARAADDMAFGIASQESVNSQWTASQDSVASLGPTSQERGNAAAREHAAWEALGELKEWDSDGDNACMQQASEILSRILSAGRPEEVSAAITSLQIRPDRHVASPEALSALLCPLLEARTSREENCARLVENTLLVHILVLKSAPPRALQACLEATIRARPRAVANGVTGSFLGRVLAGTHAPPAGELRPQLQLVGLALKAVSKASPDAVSEALEFGLATEGNTTSKLSASAASVLQLFVNLRPALSESAVCRLLELLTARAHELSTEIAADPSKVSSCKDELNKYTTLVFATASKLGSQLLSSPLLASLEQAVVDPNLKGNMIGPARKQLSSLLRKRAK